MGNRRVFRQRLHRAISDKAVIAAAERTGGMLRAMARDLGLSPKQAGVRVRATRTLFDQVNAIRRRAGRLPLMQTSAQHRNPVSGRMESGSKPPEEPCGECGHCRKAHVEGHGCVHQRCTDGAGKPKRCREWTPMEKDDEGDEEELAA